MARAAFGRPDRVAALLRREMATLVHDDVKNGVLPEISVSDVEITRDLSLATVWVTALHSQEAPIALKLLGEQIKEYRMAIAKRVQLRIVPQLKFKYDESVDRGERIEELLRGLKPRV
jgi:ribosome-binding factor A